MSKLQFSEGSFLEFYYNNKSKEQNSREYINNYNLVSKNINLIIDQLMINNTFGISKRFIATGLNELEFKLFFDSHDAFLNNKDLLKELFEHVVSISVDDKKIIDDSESFINLLKLKHSLHKNLDSQKKSTHASIKI